MDKNLKEKVLAIVKNGIVEGKNIEEKEVKSMVRVTKKIINSLIAMPSEIKEKYYCDEYENSYQLSAKGQSVSYIDNTIYLLNVEVFIDVDAYIKAKDIIIKAESKNFKFLLKVRNFNCQDEFKYSVEYYLSNGRFVTTKEYLHEKYPGARYDYHEFDSDNIFIEEPLKSFKVA